jgi:hypothetical protein
MDTDPLTREVSNKGILKFLVGTVVFNDIRAVNVIFNTLEQIIPIRRTENHNQSSEQYNLFETKIILFEIWTKGR